MYTDGISKFAPGQEIWVIERDDGEAADFAGCVFIAESGTAAIVSPYIKSCGDLDYMLSEQIENTADGDSTDLEVYPLSDCYGSREDAKKALQEETEK